MGLVHLVQNVFVSMFEMTFRTHWLLWTLRESALLLESLRTRFRMEPCCLSYD